MMCAVGSGALEKEEEFVQKCMESLSAASSQLDQVSLFVCLTSQFPLNSICIVPFITVSDIHHIIQTIETSVSRVDNSEPCQLLRSRRGYWISGVSPPKAKLLRSC